MSTVNTLEIKFRMICEDSTCDIQATLCWKHFLARKSRRRITCFGCGERRPGRRERKDDLGYVSHANAASPKIYFCNLQLHNTRKLYTTVPTICVIISAVCHYAPYCLCMSLKSGHPRRGIHTFSSNLPHPAPRTKSASGR